MRIKYRRGVVSDCGMYYIHGNKYWYTPSQHDYIIITFHSVMSRFYIYNKFNAYKSSVDYFNGVKGMLFQTKKLLLINPNHYYRLNIEKTINEYEQELIRKDIRLSSYPNIFRLIYN